MSLRKPNGINNNNIASIKAHGGIIVIRTYFRMFGMGHAVPFIRAVRCQTDS